MRGVVSGDTPAHAGLPFHAPRRMSVQPDSLRDGTYTNGIERGPVCCSHIGRDRSVAWDVRDKSQSRSDDESGCVEI